jgi:tetratricopeptide (TPR) repeat protein
LFVYIGGAKVFLGTLTFVSNLSYDLMIMVRIFESSRSGFFALAVFLIIASCNTQDTTSPYNEILSHPPYVAISDSIKRQPTDDELYFRRAVLLNKNNFPEPALVDFQKAWTLDKQERYAFGVTNVWLDKNADSAISFLNIALKELPKSFLLRLSLARAYAASGRTNEALATCDEILRSRPDEPDVLLLESELLDKKGNTKGAIASLEKAYHLVPDNAEVGFKLAYKYAETKDPRTVSLCDSLIQKDSLKMFADPFYIKGNYYANIKDQAKAIQLFDETIRRDHNYLNAYIEKGKILLAQKKMREAFKVFNLVLTVKPAFPDGWYWLGVCQEEMGNERDAKLNYEKAFSLDKSFTEAKEAAERL